MTYANLQSVAGTRLTGGSTISAQYGSNVGAGNLLVAVITRSDGLWTSTIGQVSDDQGNHWKQAVEFGGNTSISIIGPYGVDIWYCESAGGGNKPTVTATQLLFANMSGSPVYNTGINIQLLEYSGGSGFELCDQIGQGAITTTTETVTTWHNLSANHELAISAIMGNMSAATVPSGWTSRVADTVQSFYVADNVDTGGSSSGSTLGAAWTGLTGATKGVAVIATFVQSGVASTAPRLVQTSYTDSAILQLGGNAAWTSQAFPVNPTAGNTLLAVMNGSRYHSYIDCGAITSVTDSAGNTWVPLVYSGADNQTGINVQLWICRSAKGGATTLTVNFSNTSQQLCCLLLELANFPGPLIVDSFAAGVNVGDTPNQVTPIAIQAGDLAIAYRAIVLAEQTCGPNVGWKQVISDSTGANCQMLYSAPSGPLTATWVGFQASGTLDILLAALRPALGSGVH